MINNINEFFKPKKSTNNIEIANLSSNTILIEIQIFASSILVRHFIRAFIASITGIYDNCIYDKNRANNYYTTRIC